MSRMRVAIAYCPLEALEKVPLHNGVTIRRTPAGRGLEAWISWGNS